MDCNLCQAFATLDLGYSRFLECCTRLDDVSRAASERITTDQWKVARDDLLSSYSGMQKLEDISLLPILEILARQDPFMSLILRRIRSEHFDDACYLEEIVAILDELAAGKCYPPDALKYAFQGYTRGARRHVAVERYTMQRILANVTVFDQRQ